MKSIRNILLVAALLLSANLFAGSVVVKNGATDVTNGTFDMPQVTKVGDAASVATLTVVKTDMTSLSLRESGDDAISAVLSESSINLTFNPTDTAGRYVKVLTLAGLDTDGKTVSVKVTVNAVCLWGKLFFSAFSSNVVDGVSSDYLLSVDFTSFKGFQSASFEVYVYGTEEEGGERVCDSQNVKDYLKTLLTALYNLDPEDTSYETTLSDMLNEVLSQFCLPIDLQSDSYREIFLLDDNTFSFSGSIGTLPYDMAGSLYFKLTFTNTDGTTFSQYSVVEPGVELDKNHAQDAVCGFDLSNCFDDYSVAVMDTLYLMSNRCCAVYAKGEADTDGNIYKYVFVDSYDPHVQRRILTNATYKKLYFTGRCDAAFTGNASGKIDDDEVIIGVKTFLGLDGVFNIVGGGAATSTDIYLENFQVTSMSRAGGEYNNGLNFECRDMPGGSIIFAITSSAQGSGNYFNVNFHSKGENRLTSNPGVNFYLDFLGLAKVESDGFTFGSAPIAIRESVELDQANSDPLKGILATYKYNTQLNFDDYWIDGSSTNGLLDLNNNGQTNVGSIDLGNDINKCNFFGGRYKLSSGATRRTSAVHLNPISQYSYLEMYVDYFLSNSLAINYRLFRIDLFVRAFNMTVPIAMYGFGNDMVGNGQVNFYGGTFETYGVSDSYMSETNQKYEYCYFRDKYDLRIPGGSQINGGTFNNCDVYLCDTVASRGVNPINFMGDTVCKLPISQTGVNADGTAQFTIPAKFKYDIEGMGTFTYNDTYGCDGCLSSGGVNSAPKHGINADENGNVNIYVPCEMDESLEPATPIKTKFWWSTVMPQYSANHRGGTTIDNSGDLYNCYFIDVVLDSLVYKKGQIISINFTSYRGELYNKSNSTIQKRLYLVLPVETNRWYNFMAPFDISNVYEVSTTTPDPSNWSTYRNNLRDNNYKLILGFAPQLIFGGHMELKELVQFVGDSLYSNGIIPEQVRINKLNYYDGTNEATSNFYLYVPQDSVSGTRERWRTRSDGDFEHDYYFDWSYITPVNKEFKDENGDNTIDETTSNADVIMEAKHVYGLSFPGDQDYPYWNNRYLIFEGYGKQTIYGSDEQANFVTSAPEGYAQWGGNYTFTNYPAQENMYVLDNRDTKLKNGPGNNNIFVAPEDEYVDYVLTEEDKYYSTIRDNTDYTYDTFVSDCLELIEDNKGNKRAVKCSFIDTETTASICFDENGSPMPCSQFTTGFDTALVDFTPVLREKEIINSKIEATIAYGTTYSFHGKDIAEAGTYTHTVVYSDKIEVETLVLTVADPVPTISPYVAVSDLSDEQIEGLEYVIDEETSVITNNIQPHFAYMVVNRPMSAPTRYTGMTDNEGLSGLPTIGNVSYVITEIGGIVNIQTNYRQNIHIFDMTGRLVFSRAMSEGETFSTSLPSGVYIVSGATDNVKIIVR